MRFNIRTINDDKSLERKLEAMLERGEDVKKEQTAPLIYTPRADGVVAGYNIRTDRFEEALLALEKENTASIKKSTIDKLNKGSVVNGTGKEPNTGSVVNGASNESVASGVETSVTTKPK